ncbi:MAG TPA: hypothetical protein VFU02_10325 [Polyangiaceae bacterium]|nr:hypothetical protein [Polyangiaceae bacterium]
MVTHVKVLAVLYLVLSALGVLGALLMMMIFGVAASSVGMSGDPDAAAALPIIGLVGTGFVIFLLVVSVPGLVLGWGLLKLKPWARILGIVLCAINLINVPLGTILGVYGLWVLLNAETERLFSSPVAANA